MEWYSTGVAYSLHTAHYLRGKNTPLMGVDIGRDELFNEDNVQWSLLDKVVEFTAIGLHPYFVDAIDVAS